MKYALVGCGRIAPNHIKAALSNGLELIAVCDLLPEKMEAELKRQGLDRTPGIARYTDYREMAQEHPELQLVSVATSSGSHAKIALFFIERGINVIIEKPIAMSIADADAIVSAGKKYGVTVSACHQNRFNTAVSRLRSAVETGRFGRISHGCVQVRWSRERKYYEQAPWRGTWAEDGGCLMNQCIHGIDLLRWMLGGEIDTVYGVTRRQKHPYIECEDVGMAVVTFKNGAVATVEGTTNVFRGDLEETLSLFGESGTVKLGGKSVNNVDVWRFSEEKDEDSLINGFEEPASDVYGNGHTRLYADVIDAINNRRPPYVDAVAGKSALELVLAIYKSAAENRPVKLPLDDCSTLDFIGRFGKEE